MRKIKFRGKSLQTDNWVYGSLVQYGGKSYIYVPRMDEYDDFEIDPATVGQYTGLRDKNGVDIYEGDILRIRTAGRSEQTHTGENIPNGSYTEPMEPEIHEQLRVVKFQNGMFTTYDSDEDQEVFPLDWDVTSSTYATLEDLQRGFEGMWTIYSRRGHEADWECDLEYFKDEYGLDGVDAIMAYMGVEVIGNVWEVSQ